VDLPQPEWPTIVTNSPSSIENATSANTQRSPPGCGKCLVTWSISRNAMPLLAVRQRPRQAAEAGVERHADEADREDGEDDAGEREVVPLVPHEVADAGAADQHLGGDDRDPRPADRDAQAGDDGRRGGGQDHRREPSPPRQLE